MNTLAASLADLAARIDELYSACRAIPGRAHQIRKPGPKGLTERARQLLIDNFWRENPGPYWLARHIVIADSIIVGASGQVSPRVTVAEAGREAHVSAALTLEVDVDIRDDSFCIFTLTGAARPTLEHPAPGAFVVSLIPVALQKVACDVQRKADATARQAQHLSYLSGTIADAITAAIALPTQPQADTSESPGAVMEFQSTNDGKAPASAADLPSG